MLTISDIKQSGWLIFECIVGSRAYGLDTAKSDTDIKGVYILPKDQFYGLDYIGQVNNETNDIAYYELKKFIELLYKNNPNILEMLNIEDEFIISRHPIFEKIKTEIFLSKLCKDTFAGYAETQLKKARGLNKKIFNPVAKERLGVPDFCYVSEGQGSVLVRDWLKEKDYTEKNCGLAKIARMKDMHNLFYDDTGTYNFKGIVKDNNSNDVILTSIPKHMLPEAQLYFNKNRYSKYCREYKEYWDWVSKRNPYRYKNTIAHGKNYDAKNVMHTFRLLDMAEEILAEKKIITKRPNREELLKIKSGAYNFEELIERAEGKIKLIEKLAEKSDLPDRPDMLTVEKLLVDIREEWYGSP